METDYAFAVELLLGVGVEFKSAPDYETLAKTWQDKRPLPKQSELDEVYAAWVAKQAQTEQNAADAKLAEQDAVSAAKSIQGMRVDDMGINELRLAVRFLLARRGWVTSDGYIKVPDPEGLQP